jgi:hypothetical protein
LVRKEPSVAWTAIKNPEGNYLFFSSDKIGAWVGICFTNTLQEVKIASRRLDIPETIALFGGRLIYRACLRARNDAGGGYIYAFETPQQMKC